MSPTRYSHPSTPPKEFFFLLFCAVKTSRSVISSNILRGRFSRCEVSVLGGTKWPASWIQIPTSSIPSSAITRIWWLEWRPRFSLQIVDDEMFDMIRYSSLSTLTSNEALLVSAVAVASLSDKIIDPLPATAKSKYAPIHLSEWFRLLMAVCTRK